MFLENFKITKIILFAAVFLAFGFGILSAPKTQAATLTITPSIGDVTMCSTNGRTFTVKNGPVLVDGALVTVEVLGKKMGTCTTGSSGTSGACSITLFSEIVKGDAVVTASKGGDTGTLVLTAKGATTETNCKDNCDNDLDGKEDCADSGSSECPQNTICSDTGGRCNSSKTCVVPSGTLEITDYNPKTAIVGKPTNFTFTSNLIEVVFKLTGPIGGSGSGECGPIAGSKNCTINITPNAVGTIKVKATKGPAYTDSPEISIAVNAADALKITMDPFVDRITVGKSVTVNFIVRDKDSNLLAGANISITGSGIDKQNTTDSGGKWSNVVLYPTVGGTITIKATSGSLTPGSITIQAVPPGAAGVGIYGLTNRPLKDIINGITEWLLEIAAGLAILYLVWGGIYYVTASGDESQVEDAKRIIKYALIGLFVIGISYSIVVALDKLIK